MNSIMDNMELNSLDPRGREDQKGLGSRLGAKVAMPITIQPRAGVLGLHVHLTLTAPLANQKGAQNRVD